MNVAGEAPEMFCYKILSFPDEKPLYSFNAHTSTVRHAQHSTAYFDRR